MARISSKKAVTPPPAPGAVDRVLAIDPALRNTGYAVVERNGRDFRVLTYGTIKSPPKLLASGCLVAIREGLQDAIRTHSPTVCAIETTIFVQSYKTAIILGTARGACLLAAAEFGIPIYDYAPREVKLAAVGKGAADKQQVAFMIRSMLKLRETPPPDAADALAVAIAHFQNADAQRVTDREARRV